MSHRKRVQTLESFFTSNQSQSESGKNDTEEELSVIIREKRTRIEGNRKNHDITRGCAMKRSQAISSAIFVGNLTETNLFASAEECTDFCPPKNKNVPLNFSQGDKICPPVIKS